MRWRCAFYPPWLGRRAAAAPDISAKDGAAFIADTAGVSVGSLWAEP